jgi:hypothetical protein
MTRGDRPHHLDRFGQVEHGREPIAEESLLNVVKDPWRKPLGRDSSLHESFRSIHAAGGATTGANQGTR